ncbi:hypothetical protein [Streptomyces sp. NPDC056192]|uniref:hypothetical protein n=1 Tax=Streptomyces sp. NPDC056192 TaxID=3345743 RepID=UPI0035D638B3
MRLTVAVVQQLLDQNDGFEDTTRDRQKNFTIYTRYRISDGELHIQESGNTSWADSRFSNAPRVATIEQTRRFLRPRLGSLKTDGIE